MPIVPHAEEEVVLPLQPAQPGQETTGKLILKVLGPLLLVGDLLGWAREAVYATHTRFSC